MAENSDKNGERKSARGERATKRDEDVLESADNGDKKVKKVASPEATATRRGGDKTPTGEDKSAEDKPAEEKQAQKKPEKEQPKEPADHIADGEKWLAELFEKMELDLKVKGSKDGDNFVYNVTGSDAESLVGRSRQSPRTLSALQTLLAESLGRETRGKVLVDIGGYKQKQKSRLTNMADQLGKAVEKTGKPLKIAGLNSYERRVIHQHLDDLGDVDTESVDQGIFRKLRVMPN